MDVASNPMGLSAAGPLQHSSSFSSTLNYIIARARSSWLASTEVEYLLSYKGGALPINNKPPKCPTGGELFLFDRKKCRFFRSDNVKWKKNEKGVLKEWHFNLKVNGQYRVSCYYSYEQCKKRAQLPLCRRVYWLKDHRPGENTKLVLVHYLRGDEMPLQGDAEEAADTCQQQQQQQQQEQQQPCQKQPACKKRQLAETMEAATSAVQLPAALDPGQPSAQAAGQQPAPAQPNTPVQSSSPQPKQSVLLTPSSSGSVRSGLARAEAAPAGDSASPGSLLAASDTCSNLKPQELLQPLNSGHLSVVSGSLIGDSQNNCGAFKAGGLVDLLLGFDTNAYTCNSSFDICADICGRSSTALDSDWPSPEALEIELGMGEFMQTDAMRTLVAVTRLDVDCW